MKHIVLIGHKKRQGKDTFAKYLAEATGGEIIHFADPLKDIAADALGMTREELENAKDAGEYMLHTDASAALDENRGRVGYREFLQRLGQSMKSQFGENIFARHAIERIEEIDNDIVIIPDTRFPIEIAELDYMYVTTTIKVTRTCHESNDDHDSETALDGHRFDIDVEASDLETLKEIAQDVAGQIRDRD